VDPLGCHILARHKPADRLSCSHNSPHTWKAATVQKQVNLYVHCGGKLAMRLRSYPANTDILAAVEVACAAAVVGAALRMATDVRVECGMKYQTKLELV